MDVIKLLNEAKKTTNENVPLEAQRQQTAVALYELVLLHFGKNMSPDEFIENEPFLGKLGQRDELEFLAFSNTTRKHAILHDVFGRIYNQFGLGPGYTYAFRNAPHFAKSSPFLGHISGVLSCSFN